MKNRSAGRSKFTEAQIILAFKQSNTGIWVEEERNKCISKALDKWAYNNKITLDFSIPGKPTDNQ